MDKKYENPKLDVVIISDNDILTTSSGNYLIDDGFYGNGKDFFKSEGNI